MEAAVSFVTQFCEWRISHGAKDKQTKWVLKDDLLNGQTSSFIFIECQDLHKQSILSSNPFVFHISVLSQ